MYDGEGVVLRRSSDPVVRPRAINGRTIRDFGASVWSVRRVSSSLVIESRSSAVTLATSRGSLPCPSASRRSGQGASVGVQGSVAPALAVARRVTITRPIPVSPSKVSTIQASASASTANRATFDSVSSYSMVVPSTEPTSAKNRSSVAMRCCSVTSRRTTVKTRPSWTCNLESPPPLETRRRSSQTRDLCPCPHLRAVSGCEAKSRTCWRCRWRNRSGINMSRGLPSTSAALHPKVCSAPWLKMTICWRSSIEMIASDAIETRPANRASEARKASCARWRSAISRTKACHRPSGRILACSSTGTYVPSLRRNFHSDTSGVPWSNRCLEAANRPTSSGGIKSAMVFPTISSAENPSILASRSVDAKSSAFDIRNKDCVRCLLDQLARPSAGSPASAWCTRSRGAALLASSARPTTVVAATSVANKSATSSIPTATNNRESPNARNTGRARPGGADLLSNAPPGPAEVASRAMPAAGGCQKHAGGNREGRPTAPGIATRVTGALRSLLRVQSTDERRSRRKRADRQWNRPLRTGAQTRASVERQQSASQQRKGERGRRRWTAWIDLRARLDEDLIDAEVAWPRHLDDLPTPMASTITAAPPDKGAPSVPHPSQADSRCRAQQQQR